MHAATAWHRWQLGDSRHRAHLLAHLPLVVIRPLNYAAKRHSLLDLSALHAVHGAVRVHSPIPRSCGIPVEGGIELAPRLDVQAWDRPNEDSAKPISMRHLIRATVKDQVPEILQFTQKVVTTMLKDLKRCESWASIQ